MQRWWIAVVAVVGIGLAVLLFPSPDTGEDVPPPNPKIEKPLDFGVENDETKRPARRKAKTKMGERLLELRSRPDAVYAGKLTAPWTAVRYTLLTEFPEDEEASSIAADIQTLLADLQSGRRDPTKTPPLDDTVTKLAEIEARVRASSFAENATIQQALTRHQMTVTEFQSAEAPEGEPAGKPEEAP